jgi:hypothetical protein
MSDTERGAEFRYEIKLLEHLIEAYRNNDLRQTTCPSDARTIPTPDSGIKQVVV